MTKRLFSVAKDGKQLVTPKAVAAYAHIAKPDTEGQYADNKYKVTLKLKKGDKEVEAFVKSLNDFAAAATDKQKAAWNKKKLEAFDVVKDGDDKDDAEEKGWAGYWLITAKTKKAPLVVDAKKNKTSVPVFSGDVIRAKIAVCPFEKPVQGKAGLSVYLNAVQIIEKNSGGPAGTADGFEEEDGFEGGDDDIPTDAADGKADDNDGDY